MIVSQTKDIVAAVVSNPNFFSQQHAADAKIQQVVNLIISVDNAINK
jgi:hypothetical protein